MEQVFADKVFRVCSKAAYPTKIRGGFTFAEVMVVIVLMGLLMGLAMRNTGGMLSRNTFKTQTRELAKVFEMAADAAARSDRRYEIIINIDTQNYILREITGDNLVDILEKEVISDKEMSNDCWLDYVLFDDNSGVGEDGRARFRVGHNGWQYGGKVVLVDPHQRKYTLLISRYSRKVELLDGDVEILLPKRANELSI